MAKTEVHRQETDISITQTSLWGLKTKEVLILRKSEATGRISLRPRSHGIYLNREEINLWGGPVTLIEGDTIRLPWGGSFKITESVLNGAPPIIKRR